MGVPYEVAELAVESHGAGLASFAVKSGACRVPPASAIELHDVAGACGATRLELAAPIASPAVERIRAVIP